MAAVTACGLVDTLKGDRFTIFAPSDEAFAKLPEGTVEALLADIPKLTAILTLHVVPGTLGGKKVTLLLFLMTMLFLHQTSNISLGGST